VPPRPENEKSQSGLALYLQKKKSQSVENEKMSLSIQGSIHEKR
jgi:hypothetical protein